MTSAEAAIEMRWCGEKYPDWQVDEAGGVYRHGVKIAPHLAQGYPRVRCHGRGVYVHTLVCTAFYGTRPDGMECRHLNDVRTDNRAANLCWGTASENRLDAVRNGLHHAPQGQRHGSAKLTDNDVREIRRAYAEGGMSQSQLAVAYGVARNSICRIVRRQTWTHLPDEVAAA